MYLYKRSVSIICGSNSVNSTASVLAQLAQVLSATLMSAPNSSKRFHASADIIQIFDPDDVGQNISTWIHKVDQLVAVYEWTEPRMIHHAFARFKGHAEVWYRGCETSPILGRNGKGS